jgi:hypothetical protein
MPVDTVDSGMWTTCGVTNLENKSTTGWKGRKGP